MTPTEAASLTSSALQYGPWPAPTGLYQVEWPTPHHFRCPSSGTCHSVLSWKGSAPASAMGSTHWGSLASLNGW